MGEIPGNAAHPPLGYIIPTSFVLETTKLHGLRITECEACQGTGHHGGRRLPS